MKAQSNVVSRAVLVGLGVVGVATAALAGPPPWANSRNARDYREVRSEPQYARVVDVEPIVHRVRVTTPERECWNETQQVTPPAPRSGGAVIVGSLIGGVIGHQLGHSNHRAAPTFAGALVGGVIGSHIGQANAAARNANTVPVENTVERCNVNYREDYEERVDGYRVTYVYDGREYTTRMPYDPGKRIPVDVSVRPVVDRY